MGHMPVCFSLGEGDGGAYNAARSEGGLMQSTPLMPQAAPHGKHWRLIHCKPRQEACALENLERQGFECYLPMLAVEKLRQGKLLVAKEPLFPRYLFIRLASGLDAPSWAPIRSTRGVSRLVRFGVEAAKVDDELISFLQSRCNSGEDATKPLFARGERVRITSGAFAGIEGVFEMNDGDSRVMVLIELLSKPVRVPTPAVAVVRAG